MRKERGFLPCLPTKGRALPKGAPETGTSHGYQLGPQRWAWNSNAAAEVAKNPVFKHRSLPAPASQGLCSPPLPGSRDPETTSLGEHMARLRLLQRHSRLCHHRLAPHSNYNYHTHPSHLAWVSKRPLISCCLKPVLSGREQKPERNLHAEVGLKPKPKPRSCVNKEEKGKFLRADSGAVN